jgi:hypothetical protein
MRRAPKGRRGDLPWEGSAVRGRRGAGALTGFQPLGSADGPAVGVDRAAVVAVGERTLARAGAGPVAGRAERPAKTGRAVVPGRRRSDHRPEAGQRVPQRGRDGAARWRDSGRSDRPSGPRTGCDQEGDDESGRAKGPPPAVAVLLHDELLSRGRFGRWPRGGRGFCWPARAAWSDARFPPPASITVAESAEFRSLAWRPRQRSWR